MEPDEFLRAWGDDPDPLVRFPLRLLNHFPLSFGDKALLGLAGLPSGAAPCLSFGPKYAMSAMLPNEAEDNFRIGENGSGDPVVITPDGEVHYLNHDAGFSQHYINRDLSALAQALLLYRRLIEETVQTAGPDAFLDGLVPWQLRVAWLAALRSFDPRALEPGSMWAEEVATWSSGGTGEDLRG